MFKEIKQESKRALRKCRMKALNDGFGPHELNRTIAIDYVLNAETGVIGNVEVAVESQTPPQYAACVADVLRALDPLVVESNGRTAHPGKARVPPSLHCPLGEAGCSCSVDHSCFEGVCDGGVCQVLLREDEDVASDAPQEFYRDGIRLVLLRCERFAGAKANCLVSATSELRDMEIQIGGNGRGRCRELISTMYDNTNGEHVADMVQFGGRREPGCIVSNLIHKTQAQIVFEFSGVAPSVTHVAQFAPHVSVRELGMREWKRLPVDFRGQTIP